MRNFRKLKVWDDARPLVKEVYLLSTYFPEKELYGLTSQIKRAVVSIPANIAEGCSKDSQKDFNRYLKISLGSAFELETHLILANDLGFSAHFDSKELICKVQSLQKRLSSLIKYNQQS